MPSRGYQELVCTAGITRSGEWVRLYPINYRYRPSDQQFHKYQWIEIELESKGAGNDKRKESRRPNLETIKILGNPLSTKNNWLERRQVIDALPEHSVNELRPGVSGWAQINGRDTLPIPVKARLDGEYVKRQSFWFDLFIIFRTLLKIFKDDTVVEGGTGKLGKDE